MSRSIPGKWSSASTASCYTSKAAPVAFDESAVSNSIHDNRDAVIALHFGEGNAKVRFWTTDLTAEYVRLNADYRT